MSPRVGNTWFVRSFLAAAASLVASAAAAQAPIPVGPLSVRLETYASGFETTIGGIDQLSAIDMTPLGDGRQLVLTLGGLVRVVGADGAVSGGAYLNVKNANPNLNPSELAPISIAAHPDFLVQGAAGYGKFYTITQQIAGTAPADFTWAGTVNHQDVVREWSVTDPLNLGAAFAGSSRDVLRSDRPTFLHSVQDLAFDNDKYLYITSGDGGVSPSAQNNTNILGTVLRIDPLAQPGDTRPTGGLNGQYRINPANFGAADGNASTLAEIYSYGHRSPYRLNGDMETGEMWLGEVGNAAREEINRLVNGGNFGWPSREGTNGSQPAGGSIDPTFELFHNLGGQSESTNIVGGFVYRGSALPQLYGKYIFADFGENDFGQPTNVVDLFYGDPSTTAASSRDQMFQFIIDGSGQPLPERIYSIAQDEQGELYLLGGPNRTSFNNGSPSVILRLTAPLGSPNGLVGDVNQDGVLLGDGTGLPENDDVAAFIAGWYTTGHATTFDKYTHGDLNLDGITNLHDYYLLHTAYLNAGMPAPSFGVPEPSTWGLAMCGLVAVGLAAKRRRVRTRGAARSISGRASIA